MMSDPLPNSPTAASSVQTRDFNSHFTAGERTKVAPTLGTLGFSEVFHIATNEGGVYIFLFSVEQDGPKFAVGKGRGEFFAVLQTRDVLGTGRSLPIMLQYLPRVSSKAANKA